MTSAVLARSRASLVDWKTLAPGFVTALAFFVLFWQPFTTLARDWGTDSEAGHGLLLFPVALYLAWRRGLVPARPQPALGLALLAGAIMLRYVAALAAELFTMRVSMLAAAAALVLFTRGMGQLRRWWLPAVLIALSVPIPAVILGSLALPLQFQASQLGAWLLGARHVPVQLAGNVIHLPDRALFVTEACSGLRSLTALLALGVLAGGLWLRSPWARIALVVATVPVAMALNGLRIFLTGFFVYYVSPRLADGFMHYTEGWALFVVAFAVLGGFAWLLAQLEGRAGAPA
ncbi:MAG: hypothetical protein AUH42_05645 [Gemmatimonadetes bacterium 13_1_40CM_70_11]|nr:MAG: hypothetical protein AUH42_05645 [Gemmatimonadetes bacterium 13_1_40CM_70_11]